MIKCFIRISLLIFFAFFTIEAQATVISTPSTSTHNLDSGDTGRTLFITDSGSITVTGSPAVIGNASSNYIINLNRINNSTGIASDQEAVKVTNGTLSLTLTKGLISSSLDGSGLFVENGTISVNNSGSSSGVFNAINVSADGIIENTNTGGVAINFNNSNASKISTNGITNYGIIRSAGQVIRYTNAETSSSVLSITNYGTIDGTDGYAIISGDYTKIQISNSGTINGELNLGTHSNNTITGGTINGNITSQPNSYLSLSSVNLNGYVNLGGGSTAIITSSTTGSIQMDTGGVISLSNSTVGDIGTLTNNQGIVRAYSGDEVVVNSISASSPTAPKIKQLLLDNGSHMRVTQSIRVGSDGILINSANSQLTVSGNTLSGNISLGGKLNLNNSINITGAITGNGHGTLNLQNNTSYLSGNLTLTGGDTISSIISSSSGKIIVAEGSIASNSANTNLQISVVSGANIAIGNRYAIISSYDSASTLNKISDANISVNGASNHIGKYAFVSSVISSDLGHSDLVLEIERYKIASLTNSKYGRIYDIITGLSSTNGALGTLTDYLDSDSYSNSQKLDALNSASAQVDNSSNRIIFNNLNSAANLISSRLENLRSNKIDSDHKPLITSFWAEAFGSKATQTNVSGNDGYNANSSGFAIGLDKKIDKELTVGIAGIYANSAIKSSDSNKKTNINSYQINLYSGHNFEKFFINNLIGFGINEYNSNRSISAAGVISNAKYHGQNYVLRSEIGTHQKLENDFVLTPSLMITAARNSIDDYDENGAGTLNLHVKNNSTNFLEGRLGSILSKNFKYKDGLLTPNISASYGYDFIGKSQKATANFIGQNATFTSSAAKIAQGSLRIGAGLKFYSKDNFSLSADYFFEHRNKFNSNTGLIRGKYNF